MMRRPGIKNTNQIPRAKKDPDATHHSVAITYTTIQVSRRDNCVTAREAYEKSLRMLMLADPNFIEAIGHEVTVVDRKGKPVR